MDAADEIAAKIEPTERVSATDIGLSSDDKLDEHLLHTVLSRIGHHLDYEASERNTIYDRLLALETEIKNRGSRGLIRYLLPICIGVAAILAWQFYSETSKQGSATRTLELGRSESKQRIASWIQQLGWTKPPAAPENTVVRPSVPERPQAAPVAQTAPDDVTPKAPAAFSFDPEQVHQVAMDLAALRQTVEDLAASKDNMAREIAKLQAADNVTPKAAAAFSFDQEQVHQLALGLAALRQTVEELAASKDQMAREIAKLQAADAEVLAKIPAPPPQPLAARARKPMSVPPPTSRAPLARTDHKPMSVPPPNIAGTNSTH